MEGQYNQVLFGNTCSIRRKMGEQSKMGSLHENMNNYRKQLEKGAIQKAYRGLMEYIMGLRTHFNAKYPDYLVSGSIYYGYMDMTYFPVIPKTLKQRSLKIAVVFLHESFRFEIWLAGYNKKAQTKYWKLFNESGWSKYRIVPTTKGVDSILECIAVRNPDFSDLAALTKQIESKTLKFIADVEGFLSRH
jgi:hypothetical protein